MTLGQLADVLEAAARRARELSAEDRADRNDWITQTASPLGPRRHVSRVRARLAAGLDGAALIGRRALLSPAALEEELAALVKRPRRASTTATAGSTRDRLERRLGLVGGAR